jgi:hypothetical protein
MQQDQSVDDSPAAPDRSHTTHERAVRRESLNDTVFSTIPGSPAYVGQAEYYRADIPPLGLNVELHGHNSIQGSFRFVA